ncbi:ABC transporter ATP-binding protein [Methanobrevibacter ruminantium]|uniref:ABC transporter ATP-binding protein n=1 Tax=Methanobrevibacter ruminantium TaxID=83816 RepID=UPI0026F09B89|nr:ABC transporter ATP-binding protein [Methanobrevibacter ruminantium]
MIAQMCGVKKYFGNDANLVKALDGVDFEINKGEFVAILGASGSGKSTFLNLLGGLDKATEGVIDVDDYNLNEMNEKQITEFRRKHIGFVFQDYNLIPVLSVYENIVLPIRLDDKKEDEEYVQEIIEMLGISSKIDCLPQQLSGGQQQRVAIARAMASKPAIILADEPTGNLDSESTLQVMELLKKTAERYQQTIVFITHNESLTSYCDRVWQMKDGKIAEIVAKGEYRES